MRRVLVPLLILLLLFVSRAARGGEEELPQDAIDPTEVARLLLAHDDGERTRGTLLLLARIRQGGDLAAFLATMAEAQSEWADAPQRLIDRWIEEVQSGTPGERLRARRLLAALGPKAMGRLFEALLEVDGEGATTPVRPPAAPAGPRRNGQAVEPARAEGAGPRSVTVEEKEGPEVLVGFAWTLLEVPISEISGWLAKRKAANNPSAALRPLERGVAVVIAESARELIGWMAGLPEARTRRARQGARVPVGSWTPLLRGEAVSYRSRVRRTKGAWAVDTDRLHRGLQVRVLFEEGDEHLEMSLEARYTDVPAPLPREQVRPADDVEPVELERPEWVSASMTVHTPAARGVDADIVAFFPGLVPDRVVVVGIDLFAPDPPPTPLAPQQAPGKR